MGEVYEALDTRLERKVALKFLPPAYSRDPEFKSRFEHEARAAAALNHPNIITVHDLGEFEGRTFIAMELISGNTLEERIRRGDLSLQDSLKIAAQVCEGLAAAHEAGIIHRDIKPANLFISKDGRVKILDFGLAKSRRVSTDTKPGTTVGTIQYESPEQSRGAAVDARSDLFSLGVVLYEMITSQRPFKGEFEDAIKYAIIHETPEPLARYKSDVPEDLQRMVSKLLEKDPELRYQTASGLLSDLKLLQRSSGPSSVHAAYSGTTRPTAPSTSKASATPSSKRKWASFLIPAFGLVMAAALLVFKPWKVDIQPTDVAEAATERLAVMYFDNLADPGDEQRQGEVVSSLLISDLSESRRVQVVSSQRLYDILKNLGHEGTHTVTSDMATEVAMNANARWMLTGRILSAEPNWVISAELSDVRTGDLLASPSVTGQPGERIFDVVDRLTSEIRRQLAVPGSALADVDKPVIQLTTESSEAYKLYLEGVEYQYRFQHVEAEQKLRAALAIDSTFAMAHLRLGITRTAYWGDFADGKKEVDAAMRHIDRTTELESYLIRGSWHDFSGRPREALAEFQKAVEINPDDKDAYFAMGALYRRLGTAEDVRRAIASFTRVTEVDPKDANAYNSLAYAYDDAGDLEKSIWAIDKYIELAPGVPNPYDSKAELLGNNGRIPEALEAYLNALRIDSLYLPSVVGAVALYAHEQKYAEAEGLARRLISNPSPEVQARGREALARTYMHRGQMNRALAEWSEIVRMAERTPGLDLIAAFACGERAYQFAFLGKAEAASKEFSRAEDFMSRTLPREDVERLSMNEFAAIMTHAGRFEEAEAALKKVAASIGQPFAVDSNQFWRTVGENRLCRGQFDSAMVYLDRAMAGGSDFVLLYLRGRALAGARRLREAVPLLEQAEGTHDTERRIDATAAVLIHFWLAEVYEKAGRTQDALREYREFLDLWKDADPGIKQVEEAKSRLAALQS